MTKHKDMTLVVRTISYSGDGAAGHATDEYVMTPQEADDWVGFMLGKKPFVKLDWKTIRDRLFIINNKNCSIAYNISCVIMIGQHENCYNGERSVLHNRTIFLD